MNKFKNILTLSLITLILNNGSAVFADTIINNAEQCFVTRLNTKQIGYNCITQEKSQDNDGKTLITKDYSELLFKRFGNTIKMVQETTYFEDILGNPLSFKSTIKNFGKNIDITGRFISPNQISITSNINSEESTETISTDKKILFPYAINKLFKENSDKSVINYSTIYPGKDYRVITVHAVKKAEEAITTQQGTFNCTKYVLTTDLLPNVEDYEWRDENGILRQESSPILNMDKIATTRDALNKTIESVDLLQQVMIPIAQDIPSQDLLDQVFYKISTNNINKKISFVSDQRQKILQSKNNVTYLKVKSVEYNKYYKYPVNKNGFETYLKSGPYITADNPEIKVQAQTIVGNEHNAYIIAKNMEKWVYNYISNKNYNIDFASAAQTMISKQGDCTEHSVLLAALLRAANIPSKIEVGVVYSPEKKAFVYHMWVKAYIGKWLDLDSSFAPSVNFTPLQIAFTESPLNTLDDKTAITLNVINLLNNINIDIINFTKQTSSLNNITFSPVKENIPNEDYKFVSFKQTKDNSININTNIKQNAAISTNTDNQTESPALINVKNTDNTMNDFLSTAYYNLSISNVSAAKSSLQKAINSISYDNDFAIKKMSIELANAGFFNMSENLLSNIQNTDIWQSQINDIKQTYFPIKQITDNQELLLAELTGKVNLGKDYFGAINFCKKNQAEIGNIDYTHFLLAKTYQARADKNLALKEYLTAIKENPKNLNYRIELTKYYNKLNMFNNAKKEAEQIISHTPIDSDISNIAKSEFYYANTKLEYNNKAKSAYYLAKYFQSKSENQGALNILNKAIKENNINSDIYRLSGDILLNQNKSGSAMQSYNKALAQNAHNYFAMYGIGNIYTKDKSYNNALIYYTRASKLTNNPKVLLAQANTYKVLNRDKEAILTYAKVIKHDSNNYAAYYNLAEIYSKHNDNSNASKFFKYALSANPETAIPWIKLAKIEVGNKNYFLAKTYLDRALLLTDKNAEAYYELGLVYKNTNNIAEAKNSFEKAIKINPDYAEALDESRVLN